MKRILFLTNYASPYRVRFFDELGKTAEVTVLYSDRRKQITHRDGKWFEPGDGRFQSIQLGGAVGFGRKPMCFGVLPWLKRDYDAIIVAGYSSPTVILAMLWMRLRRIPFYMEIDGGLIRQDGRGKYLLKRTLVRLANRWLSTGKYPTEYLVHYGADPAKITEYPFSSLYARDILPGVVSGEKKRELRERLGIPEKKMILAIGQFIPRKGFDVLLHAAKQLDANTGIYIVGGEATPEYLTMRQELGLTNVHFLGFKPREQLADYYQAADVFTLPTREDIWGLVVGEAMAYGLPVVTTDRCVAGLELVEDGVNGYVVPVDDPEALGEKIAAVLASDREKMGTASLEKIRPYTIESMAKAHMALLQGS